MKRLLLNLAVALLVTGATFAAERAWQTGVLKDAKIDRPKVSFGVGVRDPSGVQMPTAIRETRTYVIETDEFRLELKESTTADAPILDAVVGDEVTFALEKSTVYIKEAKGKERKLSVTKNIGKPR